MFVCVRQRKEVIKKRKAKDKRLNRIGFKLRHAHKLKPAHHRLHLSFTTRSKKNILFFIYLCDYYRVIFSSPSNQVI